VKAEKSRNHRERDQFSFFGKRRVLRFATVLSDCSRTPSVLDFWLRWCRFFRLIGDTKGDFSMKKLMIALVTLASVSAFANEHAAPATTEHAAPAAEAAHAEKPHAAKKAKKAAKKAEKEAAHAEAAHEAPKTEAAHQ
jgi:hypothetical protein